MLSEPRRPIPPTSRHDPLRLRQTLVFIGFGAGLHDPNFGELLSWSRAVFSGSEYRHFRLCRSEERDRIQAQHPPDQRIFAVPFGAEHADLAPFLKKVTPAAKSPTPPRPMPVEPVGMPPKPARCIGRDSDVETLVGALLARERIPVLGPAGIGKSTICLQALHDPRVADRFGARRYFVRCDAALTADALLAQIVADLGLEASPGISAKVLGYLAEAPVALVLDNLETPWDQEQLETEKILRQLSDIESLALAVTIRGSSRPLGVAWQDALQATPLSGDDPKHLFLAIAGAKHEGDANLSRLLAALDGMPLAIELMAHAAEAEPDLESVWRRWQAERSDMLKRGKGDERLLSLAVSLELSIAGPRMTDAARRLLAMLSLVPNGIARGDVNALVPGCGHAAAATLRQAALAFDEAGRLRCLAPIRDYVSAAYPPSSDNLATLIGYQIKRTYDFDSELDEIKQKVTDLANSVSESKTKKNDQDLMALKKTMISNMEDYRALILHVLRRIAPTLRDRPDVEALCLLQLSHFSRKLAEYDYAAHPRYNEAQEYVDKALSLYRQVGDARGEADCIEELDAIARARSQTGGGGTNKKRSGSTRASRSRIRSSRRM